jgi:hypothetical protein
LLGETVLVFEGVFGACFRHRDAQAAQLAGSSRRRAWWLVLRNAEVAVLREKLL